MRYIILLLSVLTFSASAQQKPYTKIADSIAYKVIEQCKTTYPKFYREFEYIKANDSLIKNITFIQEKGVGPAFASPKGMITINLEFIINNKPNFDDNRLIVVLYHEVGHLHYYVNKKREDWNPENSEKAAFEYSLFKTKEIAEKNDCLPLKTGVKFMKLRSESDDLKDPHVRALKRMVNEPLYAGYVKYVEEKCK